MRSLPSFDKDAEDFLPDNVMHTVYENTQNAMECLFGDVPWTWEKALNKKEKKMLESEKMLESDKCSESRKNTMWAVLKDDRLTGRPEIVTEYPNDNLGIPYNLMFNALKYDAETIETQINQRDRHFEVDYKPQLQVSATATTVELKAQLNVAWEEDTWPEGPDGGRVTHTRIFSGPKRIVRGVWTDNCETVHDTWGMIWRLAGDNNNKWKVTSRLY